METDVTVDIDTRGLFQKKRVIVPIVMTVIFIIVGIYFAIYSYHYQSTDDAFVDGKIVSVAPKVQGQAVKLLVDDNQYVQKGQLLVQIDRSDYEVALKQAKAKLAEARAEVQVESKLAAQAQTQVNQSNDEVTATKSKLHYAKNDNSRYTKMYSAGISSKQDYESSSTGLTVANADYNTSVQKTKGAGAALASAVAKRDAAIAQVKKCEAEVEHAKLLLSYTDIYAPQAGRVTSRNVEQGNYVQIAQPLMAIVPDKLWITANFKETQITNMKVGQIVDIKLDAYPNKVFKGKLDSFQKATGAKSSLFPPENAVGSYVKIVQRIPVKILFTDDYSKYNIAPGMSAVPKVKVR